MLEARHARLAFERRQREVAQMRSELVGFQLDLALIRRKRSLARKSRADQPRVPAGQPEGGRWTSESGEGVGVSRNRDAGPAEASSRNVRVILAGGIKPEDYGLSVEQFASRYCIGSVQGEIPGQFRQSTVGEMLVAKKAGVPGADKCYKLLDQDRFRK